MLQWMGGSRRKVTTSRKSTHKRQKQYFEQRRRQQQHMAGSEGHSDESRIGGQLQKEGRSLDILSLLNLSTVSDEGNFCPSRSDGKIGVLRKLHISKDQTTIITNSVPPSYSVEIKEAGASPSSNQGELPYPKILLCDHDNHALNGTINSQGHQNVAAEKQLSVFDMLSDDKSEGSSERSPVHEAHVAFSIEGLGKIRAETPPHSPEQQGRMFADDCAIPRNIARQLNSSKSFNYLMNDLEQEVDAMMQDIKIPLGGNPLELIDSHGKWKPKKSTDADHKQLDSHYSDRKCSFRDRNIFCNTRRREDIWDARYSFLDDDFIHERKDDISRMYWPYKTDGDSGDFLEYEKYEMSDNAFEGHHKLKKRDVKATKLNSLEPPSWKHTSSEVDHDFTTLIGVRGRYTPVQRNYDIRDLSGQPDWPLFETEDAKDNLSLLSEESCSSSAARGETINNSPPNLMPWQSRRISNTIGRTAMKYDLDNVFAKETHCKDRDNLGQRSRKCTMNRVLPKSKTTKPVSSCFPSETRLSQTWLLEEGCNSIDIDLGFSSSHCTSEANLPSLGSKLWTEDPFGSFPVPELNFDVKSCSDRPKHGEFAQCSPFGCSTSEKFVFFQPFFRTNSCDSPVVSNVGSGSAKLDLSPESKIQVVPLDSSHTANPQRETGFPYSSVQVYIGGDDHIKSRFRSANCEQLEVEKENCPRNDLSFSDEPIVMDGSNAKNKDIECIEAEDETREDKESFRTKDSPECGEETSSSVKNHEKSESSTNEKGYNCDVDAPLPCQGGIEGNAAGSGENNGEDSSKKVMVLESYVVQLLSAEKCV